MKRNNGGIFTLVKAAICVSILCLSSYLIIPLPVSAITLQTVMVNVIALILTPGQALATIGGYLIMGALGLPVFSGGTGGAGKLFGPTGGYYFGFLVAVVAISLLKGKTPDMKRYILVTTLAGVPLMHLCAVIMMCFHNGFDLAAAFVSISLPFILGDVIKAAGASFLAVSLIRVTKRYNM